MLDKFHGLSQTISKLFNDWENLSKTAWSRDCKLNGGASKELDNTNVFFVLHSTSNSSVQIRSVLRFYKELVLR
jgi:hypothetical protein